MAATSTRTTHTQHSEASTSRCPATRQPTEYFFSGRIAISEITGDFDIVNWSLCPWEEPSFDDTPRDRRRLPLPDLNPTRLWPAEDFAGLDEYSSWESEDRPADRYLVSKKKKEKAKTKAKGKAGKSMTDPNANASDASGTPVPCKARGRSRPQLRIDTDCIPLPANANAHANVDGLSASSPLAQFRDEMKRLMSPKIQGRRKAEISIPEIQVNGEPIDVKVEQEQEQEQENAVKQPEPELSSPAREWVEKRSGQGKESKARARKTGNWSEMWKAL
jgi:hypothetical protein